MLDLYMVNRLIDLWLAEGASGGDGIVYEKVRGWLP